MSDPYIGKHDLTPAQQAVVDQPWDARVLVTAGAGAGKTHTLVRRLDALVEREELETAEILVLSFSRSAVRELSARIERHATDARRVRAQTFDSWATSLLVHAHPDRDWSAVAFDDRIVAATGAIDDGAVELTEQGVPGHVVIDEVQDLVGVRREMVQAMLDRFADNCGFTVVGDPAQSVYGFQVQDPELRAQEFNYFFDWLRGSYGDDLIELRLDHNFRARTSDARAALPFGSLLQSLPSENGAADAVGTQLHGDLRAQLMSVPSFGALDDTFTQDSLRDTIGTTAILCRDNGQALLASDILTGAGVPHGLRRSARERSAPAWLAALLSATDSTSLTRDRFDALLPQSVGRGAPAPADDLWRSLRKVAAGPRGNLDLAALRRALGAGTLPDELTAPPAATVVVSTVHRVKGLEFDRVLVAEPPVAVSPRSSAPGRAKEQDPAAEARLLYVAMTRSRDDLYRFTPPATWCIVKDQRTGRWYLRGRERWSRTGLEITARDVCHDHVPGVHELAADPQDVQARLRELVHGGTVELRLLHGFQETDDRTPPYGIFHDDRPIGIVSDVFRRDLQRLLKINANWTVDRWPARIVGLVVDGVESVVGSAAATERAGLGPAGCWLAVRLGGLGRFRWDDPVEAVGSDDGTVPQQEITT